MPVRSLRVASITNGNQIDTPPKARIMAYQYYRKNHPERMYRAPQKCIFSAIVVSALCSNPHVFPMHCGSVRGDSLLSRKKSLFFVVLYTSFITITGPNPVIFSEIKGAKTGCITFSGYVHRITPRAHAPGLTSWHVLGNMAEATGLAGNIAAAGS